MIKLWRSFSCNNSSSYRLVARFADAATAKETAAELAEFFEAQDNLSPRHEDAPLTVLARTYGFAWQDGGARYSGADVLVESEVLIVHHSYCLGLGPGVPAYLADRGATRIDRQAATDPHISVLFQATFGVDPQLDHELSSIFAQAVDPGANDTRFALKAPWVQHDAYGSTAFFRDAGTVGMYFPIDPDDVASFKTWLAGHGIDRSLIQIEEPADELLFLALAAARCTACEGLLEYLDPRLHDIETPQLACKACGGLYELSAFFTSPA